MHAYLLACMHACMHVCMQAGKQACMHACMHAPLGGWAPVGPPGLLWAPLWAGPLWAPWALMGPGHGDCLTVYEPRPRSGLGAYLIRYTYICIYMYICVHTLYEGVFSKLLLDYPTRRRGIRRWDWLPLHTAAGECPPAPRCQPRRRLAGASSAAGAAPMIQLYAYIWLCAT